MMMRPSVMSLSKLNIAVLFVLLLMHSQASIARILVVSPDSTEEYVSVLEALEDAVAGDSLKLRDGEYWEPNEIIVDSGITIFAENHGQAIIHGWPNITIFSLHGTATLIGLHVIGDPMAILQYLVRIWGGPAKIYNCRLTPWERMGTIVEVRANGNPPDISHCSLDYADGFSILANFDSTDFWMQNCYFFNGLTDTTQIHRFIRDGHDVSTLGYVTISPLADSFQWLPVGREIPPSLLPIDHTLIRVYPNPFNSTFSISLDVPLHQEVTVLLYDLLGREVDVIQRGRLESATLSYSAPASLASGIYFVRAVTARDAVMRKVVLLK